MHARDKRVDPNLNWNEVARAMSGFTGADCMGLMLRAQGMAARQVSKCGQSVGIPGCRPQVLEGTVMRRDGVAGCLFATVKTGSFNSWPLCGIQVTDLTALAVPPMAQP